MPGADRSGDELDPDASAFAACREAFPLAAGWQQRVPLRQVAPLVVNAIKCGAGYIAAVADALDSIG